MKSPNHALQRTAPGVTACATHRLRPPPPAPTHRLRRPPQSLSLGSLCLGGTQLELIAITENAETAKPISSAPQIVAEIVKATTQLYRAVGYEPPWIGYLAIEDDTCVGTCGFKSPPQNNRVEIAYFTFPEYESCGVATRMAAELIRLALDKMPAVTVAAQTLPEENSSTSVLKKLRFRLVDSVEHPEDGLVWEWRLSDIAEA